MIEIINKHYTGVINALFETNYMMFISAIICIIVSIPLGILLFSLQKEYLYKNKILHTILSFLLNSLRSVPFLIFIFILIPINRYLFKTSFGKIAAILPISLACISIYTRFVEQSLLNLPKRISLRAISMGANKFQIIYYFLLPSILNDLILSFTSVFISMLSYSTVVGVIGAGGLGAYAYRYGYQEYDYKLMYVIIIIFVVYVFIIQTLGYMLAKKFRKGDKE